MDIDALVLSRPGLALLLALAVVGMSFSIGLASYLGVLEGLWIATRTDAFRDLRRQWSKAFVLAGALSAITLLVLALSGWLDSAWSAAADGFPYRSGRLALTAFLATSLVVGAISALGLWRDPKDEAGCIALRMAIGMDVICGSLELAFGAGRTESHPALGLLSAAVLALGLCGAVLIWREQAERSRPFLAATMAMGAAGLLTPLIEWIASRP